MNDQNIVEAILNGDSDRIEACEVESQTPLMVSRIYRFKGGVTARYTHIPFVAYPRGVALNSMPKDQIEVIAPKRRIIYKTDWIDELIGE